MDIYKVGIQPLLFTGLKSDPEWLHQQTMGFLGWLEGNSDRPIWLWDIRAGQINYWIASMAFSAEERCLGNEDETFPNKLITFARKVPNYSNHLYWYNFWKAEA